MYFKISICFFFFFNDTATTEIYTLSLHDALPINHHSVHPSPGVYRAIVQVTYGLVDRKSTRLNSSHVSISYDVFCLKKKNFDGRIGMLHKHRKSDCLRMDGNRES